VWLHTARITSLASLLFKHTNVGDIIQAAKDYGISVIGSLDSYLRCTGLHLAAIQTYLAHFQLTAAAFSTAATTVAV